MPAFDMSKLARLRSGKAQTTPEQSLTSQILELNIDEVYPDPHQPRKHFDEVELQALADSIDEQGLIQPITVRKNKDQYLIVAGERRWRACKLLNQQTIRAIICSDNDENKVSYLQMVENLQRQDLNIEEIATFVCQRLSLGEKQVDIAKKLGLSKSRISEFANWNRLPECIVQAIKDGKINSIGIACTLKSIEDNDAIEDFINNNEVITRKLVADFLLNYKKQLEQPTEISNQEDVPYESESLDISSETDHISQEETTETPSEYNLVEDPINELDSDSVENSMIEEPLQRIKNPVILVHVENREAELLFKQAAKDGFVWVKFEDGSTQSVYAQSVVINCIIEA